MVVHPIQSDPHIHFSKGLFNRSRALLTATWQLVVALFDRLIGMHACTVCTAHMLQFYALMLAHAKAHSTLRVNSPYHTTILVRHTFALKQKRRPDKWLQSLLSDQKALSPLLYGVSSYCVHAPLQIVTFSHDFGHFFHQLCTKIMRVTL